MTKEDEYLPDRPIREAIVEKAVGPRIIKCSHELSLQPSFRLLVRVREDDIEEFAEANANWTVRLIVRHTFKEHRKLFHAQAIVPRDPKTGFNGFMMKGEVTIHEGVLAVKVKGWTGLYNSEGNAEWS